MDLNPGVIDTLPWKLFQKMKSVYPVKTILITPDMVNMPGVMGAYPGPAHYVAALFEREGYEVYRYRHNYDSLETQSPELGLVWMANDSVIVPGMEVHGLIGHNIRSVHRA